MAIKMRTIRFSEDSKNMEIISTAAINKEPIEKLDSITIGENLRTAYGAITKYKSALPLSLTKNFFMLANFLDHPQNREEPYIAIYDACKNIFDHMATSGMKKSDFAVCNHVIMILQIMEDMSKNRNIPTSIQNTCAKQLNNCLLKLMDFAEKRGGKQRPIILFIQAVFTSLSILALHSFNKLKTTLQGKQYNKKLENALFEVEKTFKASKSIFAAQGHIYDIKAVPLLNLVAAVVDFQSEAKNNRSFKNSSYHFSENAKNKEYNKYLERQIRQEITEVNFFIRLACTTGAILGLTEYKEALQEITAGQSIVGKLQVIANEASEIPDMGRE